VAARRAYTDEEVEAAVQALSDPDRLEEAQRVVATNAPALQRILNQVLHDADWFGGPQQQQVLEAAGVADIEARLTAVKTLLAEEAQLTMLIGVAVGYELAHELMDKEKS
jgi:hypothetical protein